MIRRGLSTSSSGPGSAAESNHLGSTTSPSSNNPAQHTTTSSAGSGRVGRGGSGGAGGTGRRGRSGLSFQERLKILFSCNRLVRASLHWKCFALSVLIYVNGVALMWCEWQKDQVSVKKVGASQFHIQHGKCGSSYVYVPVVFVVVLWVLLLIEGYHCELRRQLRVRTSCKKGYDLLDKYKRAYPIIWWRVICYHYAKRSRQTTSYRNGDAYVTTQDYYERVNTHTALAAFDFSSCGVVDKTTTDIVSLERHPIVTLTFSKTFGFSNVEAENDYLLQRSKFFEENEAKDEYIETYEGMNLTDVEFRDELTVFQDASSLPWYLSLPVFWITTVLVLSWPYRVLISCRTTHSTCVVEKVFGCRYDNPSANSNTLSNNNNNNNNNHPPPHHHHNPPPPHPNAIQLPPPHPDPTHHPPNPFCASSVSSRNRALVSAGPIGTTGGGVGVHPEELAEGIACGGVGVSELLPSYSDVMLSERLRNSANAANTATSSATVNTATTSNVQTGCADSSHSSSADSSKYRTVSIQVDPNSSTSLGAVAATTPSPTTPQQMPLPQLTNNTAVGITNSTTSKTEGGGSVPRRKISSRNSRPVSSGSVCGGGSGDCFSHIVEDDYMNVVACTHEGDQHHQMPLTNIELNPRYQPNKLHRIKCSLSFHDHASLHKQQQKYYNKQQLGNEYYNDEDDELMNGAPTGGEGESDGEGFGGYHQVNRLKRSLIRKSRSFALPIQPKLSPLCESLLSDTEC
ncbi:uncharacterized protein LOC142345762 [Convolutriloba macropyga]|uniref:uncharacterized protein LOC142345762 n=1 Tax=Convolutriloba macropyga TaxID=536237 RepID=UPI003F521F89